LHKGTVLITGGTSGLGFELVKCFLREGYDVYAFGRDEKRLFDRGERLYFLKVDFSDLSIVKRSFQSLYNNGIRFDIVINNAGVLSPPEFNITGDGLEYTFQVNFLSHLLLNEMIIKEIGNTESLTIVSVTSPVYKYVKPDFTIPDIIGYRPFKSYAESKLYLLLIGEYLQYKYPGKDLKFIGFDPGTFRSGIYRMQKNWFHKMYLVASPFMRNPSKVARILAEILLEQELVTGVVYRRKNRYRTLDHIDREEIEKFMTICSGKIESIIN
jgi:NAD(P)-dependent dehydrogenase (short-subunit alcohol dehydrogenase family)